MWRVGRRGRDGARSGGGAAGGGGSGGEDRRLAPFGSEGADAAGGIEAAEDGAGGAAFFDGVVGGFGDGFEGVDGLDAGLEGAEGVGLVGEGFEGREVGLDGGGVGEGEELGWVEFFLLGEGDHVVAEDEEGGEEVGFVVGELGEGRRARELRSCGGL